MSVHHKISKKNFKSCFCLVHDCDVVDVDDIVSLVTHKYVVGSLKNSNGDQQRIERGKIEEDFLDSLYSIGVIVAYCIQDIKLLEIEKTVNRYSMEFFRVIEEFYPEALQKLAVNSK